MNGKEPEAMAELQEKLTALTEQSAKALGQHKAMVVYLRETLKTAGEKIVAGYEHHKAAGVVFTDKGRVSSHFRSTELLLLEALARTAAESFAHLSTVPTEELAQLRKDRELLDGLERTYFDLLSDVDGVRVWRVATANRVLSRERTARAAIAAALAPAANGGEKK